MEGFLHRLQRGPDLHDIGESPLIDNRDRDEAKW